MYARSSLQRQRHSVSYTFAFPNLTKPASQQASSQQSSSIQMWLYTPIISVKVIRPGSSYCRFPEVTPRMTVSRFTGSGFFLGVSAVGILHSDRAFTHAWYPRFWNLTSLPSDEDDLLGC